MKILQAAKPSADEDGPDQSILEIQLIRFGPKSVGLGLVQTEVVHPWWKRQTFISEARNELQRPSKIGMVKVYC